jgi:hypothetical protein
MKNIILDLCGGTGAWSKPYKEAGYDVRVITLPEWDVTKVFMWKDAIGFCKSDGDGLVVQIKDIYGILSAPPCTEFSIAKGNSSRNFESAMDVVSSCMDIIWQCQTFGKLQFWAIENPRGLLRRFLGRPHYTFEQWQFGGDRVKATDIWGYFNDPIPSCKIKPPCRTGRKTGRSHAADWSRLEYPTEYEDYINQFHGDARRAASRAITPKGFAEAFFKANKVT